MIQRAWKVHRWRRCFVDYSARELRWVGSLDWLQQHNLLYGTELADDDDARWWQQHRAGAPMDREVDPWGSERLMEHLSRMWYGVRTPELQEQRRRREQEQQQQQQLQQQQQQQQQVPKAQEEVNLAPHTVEVQRSALGPVTLARSPTSETRPLASHRKVTATTVGIVKDLSLTQVGGEVAQEAAHGRLSATTQGVSLLSTRKVQPQFVVAASTSPPRSHRAPRATVPAQPTGCAPIAYALRP